MKRWCLGAILLLLAAAVTAAAVTRAGYVDFWNDGADAEDYIVELTGSQTGGETLKAYDDNMQKAELVARVRFTGERELKHQCMLSAVSVTEVYRGDPALAGAVIDLYEVNWFAVSDDLGRVYRNFSPANLMTEGDDYLIFANRKGEDGEKSRHIRFVPCNGMDGISLFRLTANHDLLMDRERIEAGTLRYGDVLRNEFLFSDRGTLAEVLQWKREVLSRFGLRAEK